MKFTSIWTIRGMTFAERIRRTRDCINLWIAHRLPKRIKYWAYIQAGSSAMFSDEVVGEQSFVELLKRMEGRPHS